jgi:hypothetical protein
MRRTYLLGYLLLTVVVSRCSSATDNDLDIGTSFASLSVAANNHPVQGTFYGHHEISTGYVSGCFSGNDVCGRWITVWNTGTPTRQLGWSQSLDKYGLNWSPQQQQSSTQFGNPGASPYNGLPFAGWSSDPSVAPVTNAAYNNSNKRMLVSNIGASNTGPGTYADDDVVIAFSDNAGLTWQGASYVDIAGPGGGGGGADDSHIASNPVGPWDTYIAWDSLNDGIPYMRQVWFDNNAVFHGGPIVAFPSSPHLQRPALGFGKVPAGCSSGGEAVFVATASGVNGGHNDCNPPFGGPRGSCAPQRATTSTTTIRPSI